MKKLLTILLATLLLAGCGNNGAKDATEKAITDYKVLLEKSMKETVSEESEVDKTYTLAFMEAIYDFDYKIEKIEEKDNEATATVTIKTMDIISFMNAYGADSEVVDTENKLMEETDETKTKEYVAVLTSKLKEYVAKTPKDYEAEISIPLVNENGNWSIDPEYDLDTNLSSAILASVLSTGE